MKSHNQYASIDKIHSSVQDMLSEARYISKPASIFPPINKSSNTHFQIHLPQTRINQHLKSILRQPEERYKRIERQKKRSLKSLQNVLQNETKRLDPQQKNNHEQITLVSKLTKRYDMQDIINNFQSQLLDHKFHYLVKKKSSRPLYHKNTINLLPLLTQLSILKPKKQQSPKQDSENKRILHKYYLTITPSDIVKARQNKQKQEPFQKQYRTIELEKYQIKDDPLLFDEKVLRKDLSKKTKKRIFSSLERKKANQKSLKKEDGINSKSNRQDIQEQKYQPWMMEHQEAQFLF